MKHIGTCLTGVGAVALLAGTAFGHPGHGLINFGGGVVHPLTGVDHLAAMVAVGLWAGTMGKRAIWMLPAAFVGMMAIGAAMGMAGLPLPLVEPGIAASVLVLGLLITFGLRMPTWGGVALVAAFAVFHGWAHGHEMGEGASGAAFGAGFLLSTITLHAVGVFLGIILRRARQYSLIRMAGLSLVACAALLIAGVL